MNNVIDLFLDVIPPNASHKARGWLGFNCPACHDMRHRGGFHETATGGFVYKCLNGGCEYENATRWEPDHPFIGRRVRQLYTLLGGDAADLAHVQKKMTRSEWLDWMMSDKSAAQSLPTATRFPAVALPPRSELLWRSTAPQAAAVRDYVRCRCHLFEDHPFYWTPQYPGHVIVPLRHRNPGDHGETNIGWIARKTSDATKDFAHIKCHDFPTDFMFNQHKLHDHDTVLVCEGQFDAIAIQALCTFGNKLSQKQINLLTGALGSSPRGDARKKIVLIPDHHGNEWRSYWQTAKQNGWSLSVPAWQSSIKDVGDAITQHGLLATMADIMTSITNDYDAAAAILTK